MRNSRTAGVTVLALLTAGCVNPAPPPFTVAPTVAAAPASLATANTCAVAITELVDARSDPDTLGVFMGKAVKAPADRQAWLRNMALELAKRGVRPVLAAEATPSANMPRLRFLLEKAWVTNVHTDIGAGVLLRIDELAQTGAPATHRFRGTKQKTTYFATGDDKLQASLDIAVGQALDAMAAHLRSRCAAA